MQFHCIFGEKIISYNIKFYFSQILPSKIKFAMLFAVPEREGVTLVTEGLVFPSVGKMSRKWQMRGKQRKNKENLPLIRFAYGSAPSPQGEGFKTLPSSYACHLPLQGRLIIGKFMISSKIPWQGSRYFTKSFAWAFLKAHRVLGQRPKVLDKFVFW